STIGPDETRSRRAANRWPASCTSMSAVMSSALTASVTTSQPPAKAAALTAVPSAPRSSTSIARRCGIARTLLIDAASTRSSSAGTPNDALAQPGDSSGPLRDPLLAAGVQLLLPDRDADLEPVDRLLAGGQRGVAVRGRDGDHHRGLADLATPGAV